MTRAAPRRRRDGDVARGGRIGRGDGPRPATGQSPPPGTRLLVIAGAGLVVGFLTGLFGVGGGFIIVPALTLAAGPAMPAAIATSLTVPMVIGSVLGARLVRRVDPDHARRAFAVLLVAVAIAV